MPSFLPVLLLFSCQRPEDGLQLSRMAPYGASVGGLTVALREADGSTLSDALSVTVQTRLGEGEWQEAEVVEVGAADHLEIVLVADNSGSEEGLLAPISEGVASFGHAVLAGGEEAQVALVRVSTEATVLLPLSDDEDAWESAVDGLFIANGWTALWDGVRRGNEVLADGAEVAAAGGLEVCLEQARRGVVVFTDGQDNNSSDEQESSYAGDGVDTTLADLFSLSVLGVGTPVYAVGVGHEVAEDQLGLLADGSGGAWRGIDAYEELSTALVETVDGIYDEVPVCFEAASCEHDQGLISVSDGTHTWEAWVDLPALCGCTRTRGYWSTHEEDWPLAELTLGDAVYTAEACLEILDSSTGGDKSLQLASQLIASKLNVAAGADDEEISSVIEAADAWLVEHPPGSGTRSWDGGEELKDALDAWNNGDTGPGHCD